MKTLIAMMSMAALVLAATPAFAVDCTTDADCAESEVCVAGVCVPNVLECATDADCTEGLVCVENVCIAEPICATDVDCLAGEICVEGVCMPDFMCETAADCLANEICVEGLCVPDGGECTGCAAWQTCVDGVCVNPESAGECEYSGQYIAEGCFGIDWIGCCGGDVLYYCDDQSGNCPLGDTCLVVLDCGATGTACGWYDQFFMCTDGEPLPSPDGDLYCDFYECIPDCAGKICGSDGCGGSCGDCADGEGCTAAGQCAGCDVVCADYECGVMGGCDCGTCGEGLQCMGGMCVAGDTCAGACGAQSAAGCYCDESCAEYGDCCPDVCDQCPELTSCGECVPDCTGKICGSDGCDGTCGDCAAGEACNEAGDACVVATCDGFCGSDSATPAGCWCDETCVDFDDCCADRCDFCPEMPDCTEGPCVAACADKCGTLGDCTCGDCGVGEVCEANVCVPDGPCVPDCTDLVCGDDGCGDSCGDCAAGETCDAGACIIEIGEDVVEPGCESDDDCADGETCNANGVCKSAGGGGGGGGTCSTGDSVPTAGLVILFGILGLAVLRRRALV
ncbi:MAG: hypothetical protein ABIK09_13340 [Pseudomonadota bacterium]